ncbi:glucose-6-phosphate isomerase [Buchnera aphidicola]|uniref:Glucose-6-phosphate isomerase n=1 Tax=Buchnera aphidicola (Stegophylla sp.) TaxID=2315800 RepID=A0A4D6Y957_9GAMM|nr:glucose-6-phosphate isomerase [Buchnera aphidicola (Stegophylla sp.)]
MKNIIPICTNAWKELNNHFSHIKNLHMVDLFCNDINRFKNFSIIFKDKILFDFSKNRITLETMKKLFNLAKEINLLESIEEMFTGEKINKTENRSVLHVALRNRSNTSILVDGNDIMPMVNKVLNDMKSFSNQVISGTWRGYSGKSIKNIVNLGIGGSDLGPRMVTKALTPYKNHLNIIYISNIDGNDILNIVNNCDFETTIFLISSKNFQTEETLTNAMTIQKYFLKKVKNQKFMDKHFFAITANIQEALTFGIDRKNIFQMWDWVGGRYSLWSAMGLSIMLSIGFDNFIKLLDGAYDMDIHFRTQTFEKNIPVILALIGIWYNNFFNTETEAILPYDQYLDQFPKYIQQSNMESNGKNIDRNGNKVYWQTGPIIWGEVGTNGQHSFYQLMHQGTKLIPCDFIAPINSHSCLFHHHKILLSNFFAQTHALAFGKYFIQKKNNIFLYDSENKNIDSNKFKYFEGNRPSNTILLNKITPYSLGVLIAVYEHKIFVQGMILNVFSFDQWGVELGKNVSSDVLNMLKLTKNDLKYDSSTNNLINFYNHLYDKRK